MPDDTPTLTPIQRKVLRYINEWCEQQHEAPSLGEITDYMKWKSHTGAVQVIRALIILGVLRQPFPKGKARNFAVTDAGKALLDG